MIDKTGIYNFAIELLEKRGYQYIYAPSIAPDLSACDAQAGSNTPNKENTMKNNLPDNQTNFLLYTGNDGKVNVEVFLKDETVWLTQKAMAELFCVNIPAISKHLSNIFENGELQKEATLSILETVQMEGNRQVKMKMADWIEFLHNILELSNYPILQDTGKVSALEAKLKAGQEYEEYRVTQDRDFISDFDKEIKRISNGKLKMDNDKS